MALTDLEGASFGPFPYRTSVEKVGEFVAATRDDPARWSAAAPPSLAGALLFVVAPHLLEDPHVRGRSVIHGDQSFTWHRAIPLQSDLAVTATVPRVRERGGVFFVSFSMQVEDADGSLLEGASTFLMSGAGAPGTGTAEEPEPAPDESGPNDPVVAGDDAPLRRSASRSDLVRYAGASRDFNPIHWDHQAAVSAGLPGVVVHGLLQSAWICQAAARQRSGDHPLAAAKFRYRAPLRPGVGAEVAGDVAAGEASLTLAAAGTVCVASTLLLTPQ